MDGDLAAGHPGQDLAQGRQVEHVGEALAIGLDEDRERAVAAGHGQQVGRSLALLPERRPGPRPAARQQERAGRVLAEARREQRGVGDLRDDEVLDLVGVREEQVLDAGEIALGQADRDPVVGPDGLDLGPHPLAEASLERQRPRRVDARPERRQEAQPPIAELVAEALDHDPPIRRQGAGAVALVLEVGDEVLGGERIEVVPLRQPPKRRLPTAVTSRQVALDLADELAEGLAELDRPADGVAVPERQLARLARERA